MCLAVAIALMLSMSQGLIVQQTNDALGAELFEQYKAWFAALDRGDGAAMDAMEVDDLIVLAQNGALWEKHGPRAGNQPVQPIVPDRTWSHGVLRRFQDTAILTGRITNKTPKQTWTVSTAAVFVMRGGKWLIASLQWTPVQPDGW
jgi:hypothetical protein